MTFDWLILVESVMIGVETFPIAKQKNVFHYNSLASKRKLFSSKCIHLIHSDCLTQRL